MEKEIDKKDKDQIDQYFYVKENNVVQLIYPNYADKSKNYLAQDLIVDKVEIRQVYSNDYKKITVIKEDHIHGKKNSLRKIQSLKK